MDRLSRGYIGRTDTLCWRPPAPSSLYWARCCIQIPLASCPLLSTELFLWICFWWNDIWCQSIKSEGTTGDDSQTRNWNMQNVPQGWVSILITINLGLKLVQWFKKTHHCQLATWHVPEDAKKELICTVSNQWAQCVILWLVRPVDTTMIFMNFMKPILYNDNWPVVVYIL